MATPPPIPVACARAWAAEYRAMRRAVAVAMDKGQVSASSAAPEQLYAVLLGMLADVDELPPTGTVRQLPTMLDPDFAAFAHYTRVVWSWVDALSAEGVIPMFADPGARRFEQWLHDAAAGPRWDPPAEPAPRVK